VLLPEAEQQFLLYSKELCGRGNNQPERDRSLTFQSSAVSTAGAGCNGGRGSMVAVSHQLFSTTVSGFQLQLNHIIFQNAKLFTAKE
jgi:hypothetical protein